MSQNVVLVTVDSLRADHCSFAGYERETTPTLDRMAEDGLVFENAISPGAITPESMPAIFTGRYPIAPAEGGDRIATTQERIRRHMRMSDTLTEKLSRMGYATAGFTPNPWTSRFFGFDQGFDRFEDYMDEDVSSTIWERMLGGTESRALSATRLLLSWLQRENVFKPWTEYADEIVEWTETADEPFFLWVFLLDVHFPYLAGEYRTQSRWREYEANLRLYLESQRTPYSPRVHEALRTAYDDSIRFTDAFFERLRGAVPDDTAFVVTADHGEAFGEHGSYTHQNRLYEENVRVPLVVTGGGSGSVDRPVSLRSIPDVVTGLAREGSVPDVTEEFVFSKTGEGAEERVALRGERVKYIRNGTQEELYDLDRGERAPVSDEELAALCRDVLGTKLQDGAEAKRVHEAARTAAGGL